MKSREELKAWLESNDSELESIISSDIGRHVELLRFSGLDFYGYAALPGEHTTMPNPATLAAAYNCNTDIEPKDAHDPYYRYCVNEWQNFVMDGFDASVACLERRLRDFRSIHPTDPRRTVFDEVEPAFFARINHSILNAMQKLRNTATFAEETFLIVWFPHPNEEITNRSARVLNSEGVYQLYAEHVE